MLCLQTCDGEGKGKGGHQFCTPISHLTSHFARHLTSTSPATPHNQPPHNQPPLHQPPSHQHLISCPISHHFISCAPHQLCTSSAVHLISTSSAVLQVSELRSELEEHQLRLRELEAACRIGTAECGRTQDSEGTGMLTIEQELRGLIKQSPAKSRPSGAKVVSCA